MREQRSKKDEYQKALAAFSMAVKEFQKGEFEKAALLRDQIFELRQELQATDENVPEWERVRKMTA